MDNCIFCKIVNKEIPSKKIYEDDEFLSFLDINPITRGHTLLISKVHFDNLLDVYDETLSSALIVARKIGNKMIEVLNATGCNVLINTNPSAGKEVMHFHIHIIPRYEVSEMKIEYNKKDYQLEEVFKLFN